MARVRKDLNENKARQSLNTATRIAATTVDVGVPRPLSYWLGPQNGQPKESKYSLTTLPTNVGVVQIGGANVNFSTSPLLTTDPTVVLSEDFDTTYILFAQAGDVVQAMKGSTGAGITGASIFQEIYTALQAILSASAPTNQGTASFGPAEIATSTGLTTKASIAVTAGQRVRYCLSMAPFAASGKVIAAITVIGATSGKLFAMTLGGVAASEFIAPVSETLNVQVQNSDTSNYYLMGATINTEST